MVNVIEKRKYIAASKPINAQPCAGTLNSTSITTPVVRHPMSCHGLYLPHFVRVFSTMPPMIGSLNASKILASTMMIVIAENCAVLRLFVNTQNDKRYPLNRLYKKSLPSVPNAYINRLRLDSLSSLKRLPSSFAELLISTAFRSFFCIIFPFMLDT